MYRLRVTSIQSHVANLPCFNLQELGRFIYNLEARTSSRILTIPFLSHTNARSGRMKLFLGMTVARL